MPPEFQILQYSFRPWTPADSLVVVKIFFEALSDTWRLDVMRQALSVLPAEKRAELLPEISPIDVLVVGKDTQSKAKSAARIKREASLTRSACETCAQPGNRGRCTGSHRLSR